MHFTHARLARRGTALAAVALVALSAACASAKKPAQTDSQAARPDVAQGPDGGRGGRFGGPGGRDMRLFEGITLTDAQRTQVDSIRASYRDRMMAARDNSGGDRSQMRQMMQEQMSAIRTVLTPEQQATFDKNVERMRSERGRRGPGGGPGGPGGGAGR